MATCKTAKRDLRSAIREEKAAHAAVRAANARVKEATAHLRVYRGEGWNQPASAADRARIEPIIAEAQAASDRWFRANAELVNKRAFAEATCQRKARR